MLLWHTAQDDALAILDLWESAAMQAHYGDDSKRGEAELLRDEYDKALAKYRADLTRHYSLWSISVEGAMAQGLYFEG